MMLLDTSIQRLEIPEDVHENAWALSQTATVPGLRLQIYWNLVGLEVLQPWLADRFADAALSVSRPSPDPQRWELVPGFSLALRRADHPPLTLVCLPDEGMGRDELRVPQEWVDVPRWVGDYYLAVEVNPDERWIEVWAYSTHAQIKAQGEYDPCDRTYCLSEPDLISDLNCLWVMLQVGNEQTREAIAPLPPLAAERRDALVQQLSQPASLLPRLQVPFTDWGAFLAEASLFEQICQGRRAGAAQPPAEATGEPQITRLGQWLDNLFEAGWQSLEDLFGSAPELALGLRRETEGNVVRRAKGVSLGAPYPPLWLLVVLEPEADGRLGVRIRLLPRSTDAHLPEAVRLTLCSEAGDVVQSVQARQRDESIQLKRFRCPAGMTFMVEVAIANATISETFLT
ncbi:MAG: DUF1822 family protein [Elainellaceae cyanobacterium]